MRPPVDVPAIEIDALEEAFQPRFAREALEQDHRNDPADPAAVDRENSVPGHGNLRSSAKRSAGSGSSGRGYGRGVTTTRSVRPLEPPWARYTTPLSVTAGLRAPACVGTTATTRQASPARSTRGDRELPRPRRADVEAMRRRRVVDVVDAVARVDGRQDRARRAPRRAPSTFALQATMSCPASGVDAQPVRPVLAARRASTSRPSGGVARSIASVRSLSSRFV